MPRPALAAPPTQVLIVRGESPDLPAGRAVVDAVEASIQGHTTPVDFYTETIETGRFTGEAYERRLGDLLAVKYGGRRLDLVVAFSAPAVAFVLRERTRLFPESPLLLGMIPSRLLDERALPPHTSVVYLRIDPSATLRMAFRGLPSARRVLVVGGSSRSDRIWMDLVRDELRDFDANVPVAYDVDSSIEDLARKVSTLPADTVVLYVSMTRDAAGAGARSVDVLKALRATAKVPIFGLSSVHVGAGSVGGVVVDFDRHGADLGQQAIRILSGERPASLTTPAVASVDWRELQRFQIPLASLPPGTAVGFRSPGLWDRDRGTILSGSIILVAEAALILALVWTGRRRRATRRLLEARLRFERALSELAVSLAPVPPESIDEALDAALSRVAAVLGIDWVWRWDCGTAEDAAWDSAPLRAGEPARFAEPADLPPALRRRLAEAGAASCSAVAVPLVAEDVMSGALFWVSRDADASWSAWADELPVVAAVVATLLRRKAAQVARGASDRLNGAILDSLPVQVAVLDREGTIIAVNHAWSAFGSPGGLVSREAAGPGTSYLRVCLDAARAGFPGASETVTVIEQACRGRRTERQVEYRCDSPVAERWFLMRADPLRRAEGGAVVTHWDITARKVNEIALRESEDRFRRMADPLPVAVWMSEADGRRSYVNKEWLQLTGRTLEDERGDGWLESVHPDDRSAWIEGYRRASELREGFRIEYRIRRRDGDYRWLIDTGMPRQGSDGAFHGYLGGCVDITERAEVERMLRDLNHRLMLAQDDERRRIARELHDHLSQQIALLAIDLQVLSAESEANADGRGPALLDAWRQTAEIASDVHAISHRLHPSKMEALGLVATINGHCRDMSKQGLAVHFRHHLVPARIPPDRALSLFRVLEGALSNVIRHSGAKDAQVTLVGAGSRLILRVSDSGRGFTVAGEAASGLGLISMRERLQSLDGSLSVTTAPGQGTVIEASVPVEAEVPAAPLSIYDMSADDRPVRWRRAESA